jgi:biopolymer transport protein ExbD
MNPAGLGQRRYRTRLKYRSGWPELTALVDILFLALLFFALTSNFVRVSGIDIALPQVNTRTTAALERFVISLAISDSEGDPGGVRIYFREKRCRGIDELRQELSELYDSSPRASVIIRADRSVPFEEVAKVMDAAKKAQLACFIAVDAPAMELSAAYEK